MFMTLQKVKSLKMSLSVKQILPALLAEPMQAANTSTRFASNRILGSRSSIFQLVHPSGSARQMDWLELNRLAKKEPILPSGLPNSSIWPLISSCLSMVTLRTGSWPKKIRSMDQVTALPREQP